jgi:hypothetical protein
VKDLAVRNANHGKNAFNCCQRTTWSQTGHCGTMPMKSRAEARSDCNTQNAERRPSDSHRKLDRFQVEMRGQRSFQRLNGGSRRGTDNDRVWQQRRTQTFEIINVELLVTEISITHL